MPSSHIPLLALALALLALPPAQCLSPRSPSLLEDSLSLVDVLSVVASSAAELDLALAAPGPAAAADADLGSDAERRLQAACRFPDGTGQPEDIALGGGAYYFSCNSLVPTSMMYRIDVINGGADFLEVRVAAKDDCRGMYMPPQNTLGVIPSSYLTHINVTTTFKGPTGCWYIICNNLFVNCHAIVEITKISVPPPPPKPSWFTLGHITALSSALVVGCFLLNVVICCVACCFKSVGFCHNTCLCIDRRYPKVISRYRSWWGLKETAVEDPLSGKIVRVIVREEVISMGAKAYKQVPKCNVCRQDLPKTVTHWTCSDCEFDMCDSCFDGTSAKRRAALHGHALITLQGEVPYVAAKFLPKQGEKSKWTAPDKCASCWRLLFKGEQRWTCTDDMCRYELCITCRAGSGALLKPIAHQHELAFVGGFMAAVASQSGAILSRHTRKVEIVNAEELEGRGSGWGGVVQLASGQDAIAALASNGLVDALVYTAPAAAAAGAAGGSTGELTSRSRSNSLRGGPAPGEQPSSRVSRSNSIRSGQAPVKISGGGSTTA